MHAALREGKSCVIGKKHQLLVPPVVRCDCCDNDSADNTNRDARTRRYYIDIARELKVPVR